jgi:bifunctional non-homologous end joining protein LigD
VKWREAREMALRRNAYDLMQLDGRDKERRKQLARLLSRSNKAMREGIELSEAITVDGGAIFRHACGLGLEGIVSKRLGSRSSAVGRAHG